MTTTRERQTANHCLTSLLGTPITEAQGRLRGRLADIAIGIGADAGRVAGLVVFMPI